MKFLVASIVVLSWLIFLNGVDRFKEPCVSYSYVEKDIPIRYDPFGEKLFDYERQTVRECDVN